MTERNERFEKEKHERRMWDMTKGLRIDGNCGAPRRAHAAALFHYPCYERGLRRASARALRAQMTSMC
eukprot:8188752-Pyramimonas_sp.AAC.1